MITGLAGGLIRASIAQLAAEYEAGTSAAELDQRYGMAKSSVVTLLRAAGVALRYPRLSAADVTLIVELYGQGLPQAEIAAHVGRSPGAIWHVLERAGVVGRRQKFCERQLRLDGLVLIYRQYY